MWALRRASNSLRRGFGVGPARAFCVNSDTRAGYPNKSGSGTSQSMSEQCLALNKFYHLVHGSSRVTMGRRGLSSQAGRESSSEEESDDGFSELETPTSATQEDDVQDANDEELMSEVEFSDEENADNVEETTPNDLLENEEAEPSEESSSRKKVSMEIFKALTAPGVYVPNVLDKWVEDGKDLDKADIALTMLQLRRRRMYAKALQLSEWAEAKGHVELVERDYASRLDLIAKVRGLFKAEAYIDKIPKSFRGELIYRTLLANCVIENNLKKSEQVFNKMKDLGFPVSAFACNQLLLLYKRHDKKKIADVLLLMEKENVKPTLFTYRLLIDTKGQYNDITGMDQIVETMKAEGIEPDINTQATLAKHYLSGGLREKAEAILKEMEGGNLKEHRWVCRLLLPLYADLGKADEVRRIWKVCESNPRLEECISAIEAWGKLKNTEEAEAIFDMAVKGRKKKSSKVFTTLLKVYANNKMLTKGKDLVKRMGDSGCRIGPLTWDGLVKLYVDAGEVEKADSVLQKAAEQNQLKPMFSSYMVIMDHYAKRGDIHNTEKIFHRMKQAGYTARLRQYQALVQAYINAKSPAYGIRERMKAENIFPNKALASQLVQVDAFRKTSVSDLLD